MVVNLVGVARVNSDEMDADSVSFIGGLIGNVDEEGVWVLVCIVFCSMDVDAQHAYDPQV